MTNTTFTPWDTEVARRRCVNLRRRILDLSQKVSALHIAPAFSCLELVDTIYHGLMRRDENGNSLDTFIISKGHGSLAQYVTLEALGIIKTEELNRFCKPGGIYATHPDYGTPGIEASTGSLGHGMALAVGMGYADRVSKIDRNIFVVLSDGEMQEGSTWEAMLVAPSLKVNNLIAFLDLNDYQSFGKTSINHPNFYPILDKIRAFGWETIEIDGHSSSQILSAFFNRKGSSPMLVVGRTTKGKGVSFMEGAPIWHYRSPSQEEYQKALRELEESIL